MFSPNDLNISQNIKSPSISSVSSSLHTPTVVEDFATLSDGLRARSRSRVPQPFRVSNEEISLHQLPSNFPFPPPSLPSYYTDLIKWQWLASQHRGIQPNPTSIARPPTPAKTHQLGSHTSFLDQTSPHQTFDLVFFLFCFFKQFLVSHPEPTSEDSGHDCPG